MLTGRSETLEGHFVFLNTDLIKIVSELIFLFVTREVLFFIFSPSHLLGIFPGQSVSSLPTSLW